MVETMTGSDFYGKLESLMVRPKPFEFYTADVLWTDPHIATQMLKSHLDQDTDAASRRLGFVDRSVEWMRSHFGIGPGIRIADFGCGPGLYATRLAASDADVTGIDFSRGSLRYARESADSGGLTVDFVHADYLEFESKKRFDLIIMIYCDFCALSPAQRSSLLGIFAHHLESGGAVFLDVCSEAAYGGLEEKSSWVYSRGGGFWSAEDYFEFLVTHKYDSERVVLDRYAVVTPSRDFTIYNWLQFYDRERLVDEFGRNGFRIESCYANVAGDPYSPDGPEIAVVARRHG
jgi:SAM-dependent methyltransferase